MEIKLQPEKKYNFLCKGIPKYLKLLGALKSHMLKTHPKICSLFYLMELPKFLSLQVLPHRAQY